MAGGNRNHAAGRLGWKKYVTAQMYLQPRRTGPRYEFQSFAEYHNIGILFGAHLLAASSQEVQPRYSCCRRHTIREAGSFVPFDQEMGYASWKR